MRLQPSARSISSCVAAAGADAALRENNTKTLHALLDGDAAGLRGLRVLLLSDSTDYNALAYMGTAAAASSAAVFYFLFSAHLRLLRRRNHSADCSIMQMAMYAADF
jgi:hypothetical protein